MLVSCTSTTGPAGAISTETARHSPPSRPAFLLQSSRMREGLAKQRFMKVDALSCDTWRDAMAAFGVQTMQEHGHAVASELAVYGTSWTSPVPNSNLRLLIQTTWLPPTTHTQEVSAHGTRTRAMVGLFPDGINSECSRCRAFPRQAAHPWNLDCLWFLLSGVCLLTGSVGGSWIARRPCGLQICLDLCLTYKFLQATLTCLYSSGQQAASYRVGNAPNSGAEENHCGFSGTVR